MPNGPITIQFSGLLTYIIFSGIVMVSVGILVKKGWDTIFSGKKKLSEAITKKDMELYVQGYVAEAIKTATKEFATACLEKRSNCLPLAAAIADMKEVSKEFKLEVRILHDKVEKNFLNLNDSVKQIIQNQKGIAT